MLKNKLNLNQWLIVDNRPNAVSEIIKLFVNFKLYYKIIVRYINKYPLQYAFVKKIAEFRLALRSKLLVSGFKQKWTSEPFMAQVHASRMMTRLIRQ